jgi:type II secretory ATPase GspE/PulE/Tfp pilus assembly ATPase PilB-like protein
MNTVAGTPNRPGADGADVRLLFFKTLHSLTNKIHATSNVDEIILDLSQEICELFNCERLTLYVVSEDKKNIISKVKTGLTSFSDLKLTISDRSIAGYAAFSKKIINLRDAYDQTELDAYSPGLSFQEGVDKRSGFRTKQMLTAPILNQKNKELLGVVQFINNRTGDAFTSIAAEGVKELCETLAVAIVQRNKPVVVVRSKFDGLIASGVLSAPEFELATRSARRKNVDIEDVLVGEFQVPFAAVGAALVQFFGVAYEAFKSERLKPMELLKNLKRDYVEQMQWLPIEDGKDGLMILCTDPERIKSSNIAKTIFHKARLVYLVTTNREFAMTVDQFFGATSTGDNSSVDDLLLDMAEDEEGEVPADVSVAVENELVKLVNKIVVDAYKQGASDIHIEPLPGKGKTGIRFRKDGTLVPYIEIPASYRSALVARIKIMCDLDISERRKPQDGKIKFKKYGPLDIELRVATIPSAGGVEDIVMRILAAGEPIPLDNLGVLPHNLQRLKTAIEKPYGLFFVCGPTGSGKTTTLHSVLNYLNRPETKIWTAEDPVEITQKGLRQVQVNRKAGLDFATVMRAFLRADPDIIMVGEMRDKETVSMGIEASLTGHLVLATLHTNSAPESIVRLLDMGMDPFNFADALLGILAQRLAKRLCKKCKKAYQPAPEEVQKMLDEYCEELLNTASFIADAKAGKAAVLAGWKRNYANSEGNFTLYRAIGCDECTKGYKGRVGLHELMIGTDKVKKLLQEHSRVAQLLAAALEDGMLTLKMDGIEKVLSGLTDVKMVRAVCVK